MSSKRVVVVGIGMQAEQVEYYLSSQDGRVVDAFVLDPEYLREPTFLDRPVLDFETVQQRFPPATHDVFIAIGMTAASARKRWFQGARDAGYALASFVHETAWIAGNAQVGAGAFIKERVVVSPFARLGDNVVMAASGQVSHHSRIGSHSFLSTSVAIAGGAVIGEGCFIGCNATVRDRVNIGDGCVIGAGAVVMADCAPRGVYRAVRTERTRELED